MKKILLICLCILLQTIYLFPQSTIQEINNFGYTTQVITTMSNVSQSYDLIFETNAIYYVNTSNQICAATYNGSWTTTVLNSTYLIRAGAKIHKTGQNTIYYVGTDSKVHRLQKTSGWNHSIIVPTQNNVRNDADIMYSFPHIYYIDVNSMVSDIATFDNENTWVGGTQVLWNNPMPVRANSKLIQPVNLNLIYYIGTNSLIYELAYNNGWFGGQTPLSTAIVKPNTNLETNGYAFFYVDAFSNKVSALYWNNSWQVQILQCIENVRTDVELKYADNSILYVGAASGKINITTLNSSGQWLAVPVNPSSTVVKTSSKILAYTNTILEEGSNNTFNSTNIFYTDVSNKLSYLVFDDTPCLNYKNPLWKCAACLVNGVSPKSWIFGQNDEVGNLVHSNLYKIGQSNKNIYFIDQTNNVKLMSRISIINPLIKTNWTSTFSDECTSLTNTQTKWYSQFPHGNTHQPWNLSHYKNYDNLSYNGGYMQIITKKENYLASYWRKNNNWITDDCYNQQYQYTSTSLHTGCKNCDPYVPDTPPINPFISCGPTPAEHKLYQKYGWYETRCKIPRGKGMWSAFWLLPNDYTWTNEIDVFEVPGNGKFIAQTNHTTWVNGDPAQGKNSDAIVSYCIGFRAYDDYYTYAVNWSSAGIKFYFNNKQVGTMLTNTVPQMPMYMIVNNYVKENGSSFNPPNTDTMINCEVENFPNYWGIDYIRTYSYSGPKNSTFSENDYTEQGLNATIYPQPASNFISVELPDEIEPNIHFFDLTGRLVKQISNYKSQTTVDISEIPSGTYFMEIQYGDRVLKKKISIIK